MSHVFCRFDPGADRILHVWTASSGVSPSEKHPGRSGTEAAKPPPSSAERGVTTIGSMRKFKGFA
ncbi:hypothetical protein Mnod_1277 [Methylobacterium nodulans ORS 2060]|uniref:Uncharacterized protein n=1 Tax=Methylobacterium nodulans (strain LMG 21967 / CNCM I-2342 / ORS 2060) TaxID=460265 RepID=B8IKS1_METNO|nr:hypothetical protein Mnod_1277 [Methylobacterium nodulans ORS 2060]